MKQAVAFIVAALSALINIWNRYGTVNTEKVAFEKRKNEKFSKYLSGADDLLRFSSKLIDDQRLNFFQCMSS